MSKRLSASGNESFIRHNFSMNWSMKGLRIVRNLLPISHFSGHRISSPFCRKSRWQNCYFTIFLLNILVDLVVLQKLKPHLPPLRKKICPHHCGFDLYFLWPEREQLRVLVNCEEKHCWLGLETKHEPYEWERCWFTINFRGQNKNENHTVERFVSDKTRETRKCDDR